MHPAALQAGQLRQKLVLATAHLQLIVRLPRF
jgi:hypothetical protein